MFGPLATVFALADLPDGGRGVHLHADQLGASGPRPRVHYATGNAQAAYLRNLPSTGRYEMLPEKFFELTERNEMPLNQIPAVNAFGTAYQARINNVGLVAALILDVNGSVSCTIGTGTLTARPGWPCSQRKSITRRRGSPRWAPNQAESTRGPTVFMPGPMLGDATARRDRARLRRPAIAPGTASRR